ncbi:unnamed protein product [Rhodiola kirilowii]
MSLVDPLSTSSEVLQQEPEKSAWFPILEILRSMDPHVWHKVAAVSGVAAVGLGAYGSHVFKPKNLAYKDVWQTAALYHLIHSAALLSAPMVKRPHIFGGLLTTGILAFSGTCYAVAVLEDRKYSALAPFGGFAFMAAWGSLLF